MICLKIYSLFVFSSVYQVRFLLRWTISHNAL